MSEVDDPTTVPIAKPSVDPGGARQGNFINYYQFNPPAQRLSHIPPNLLEDVTSPCVALDVGCNSGDMTVNLPSHFSCNPMHIMGVDVDPELIAVAKRDHKQSQESQNGSVTFESLDLTSGPKVDTVVADYLGKVGKPKFDVVFCFSVTMWVHLNHGDRGLEALFQALSRWCARYLVLEPQLWKCYRQASRRMRKLKQPDFDHLPKLEAQSEEQLQAYMGKLCRQHGFKQVKVFGETENWKRRVILYETGQQH